MTGVALIVIVEIDAEEKAEDDSPDAVKCRM
jgi:hypothetical protein